MQEKRERERERRRRIREDPVKREEQREKERQKYLKQKQNKVKKSINEMTPREQRKQRKKWRDNIRNFRLKRKQMDEETVTTPDHEVQIENPVHQQKPGRKKNYKILNRNKINRFRKTEKTKKQIEQLKRTAYRYKKRYQRLLKSVEKNKENTLMDVELTPVTKINTLINETQTHDSKKVQQVKKSLIFNEVVKKQLAESYTELKTEKTKRLFKKILNGRVVKKYNMKTALSTVIKYRKTPIFERNIGNKKKVSYLLRNRIQAFLESEINSRVCPGKKDCVTKNKDVKQKRFLCNTLKNLYREFIRLNPNIKLSYVFFCRARPFWITQMKVTDRDTCKCVTHANMELLVHGLYQNDIIFGKKVDDVIRDICCSDQSEACLLRQCETCKDSKPLYKEYDPTRPISYFQWISVKENYFDKKTKQMKQSKKIAKQPQQKKATEVVNIFSKKLELFMGHQARIIHQYNIHSKLKQDLKPSEIIIHCDFSENYGLKYAQETQSFHFGGARQQITLHTVVVYSSESKPKSFCTLSESLNHGPSAIWAHLEPIMVQYCDEGIDTIHFLSDSPTTQYRNKQMFAFLATQLYKCFPKIKRCTWNYQEAGHGKGAPDGIGGVCKRTADRCVAQGRDIPNFSTLVNILKECCPGVLFYTVSLEKIEQFSKIIENNCALISFKGTMKVHQVITNGMNKLWLRSLSCFICDTFCQHYELGVLQYTDPTASSSEDDTLDDTEIISNDVARAVESKIKVNVDDIYSSDDDELSLCLLKANAEKKTVKTGSYILVSLKSDKKHGSNYKYVAVCQSDIEDNEIKVAFLKLCDFQTKDLFKLKENDLSYLKKEQILQVLPEPKLVLKGCRVYYKFPTSIDVFECT